MTLFPTINFRKIIPLIFILLTVIGLTSCSLSYDDKQTFLKPLGVSLPTKDTTFICHGYSCYYKTPIHTEEILAILVNNISTKNKQLERETLGLAIAEIEKMIGRSIGTDGDKGGFQKNEGWTQLHTWGNSTQQDCIDEAANTTNYIYIAEMNGLLKHHKISPPAVRGNLIDFRYPHTSAVIEAVGSQEKWVIDTWFGDNGEAPLIQPLDEWKSSY